MENVDFTKIPNAYAFERTYYKYQANKQFEFEIPAGSEKSTVLVENIKGKNYFEIIAKPEIIEREKPNPKEISIYWDASGSMAKRDTAKEFALLDGYLNKIQNCKINLNIFDINKIKKEEFTIKNGDFTALKARLANIDYDGGTQLGVLDLSQDKADEILLFSDGMADFGERELKSGNAPIYAINSNQSAEHSYLRYLAQISGGEYINLNSSDAESALKALINQNYALISSSGANCKNVYPSVKTAIKGAISLAGELSGNSGEIILNYGFGSEIVKSDTFKLDAKANSANTGILNRIWAQKKIAELDARFEKNKDEITKTAKEFSVVTRNTSLIVLETVWDYIRYKIEPPDELRAEFEKAKEQMEKEKVNITVLDSMSKAKSILNKFYNWYFDTYNSNNKSDYSKYDEFKNISLKIYGKVKDTDENIISGVNVSIGNFNTVSNLAGEYTLELESIPTNLDIQFKKEGFYTYYKYLNINYNSTVEFSPKLLKIINVKVKGKVLDENRIPIDSVEVKIYHDHLKSNSNTITNSKGEFQFDEIEISSDGYYSITLNKNNYYNQTFNIVDNSKKEINFDMILTKERYANIYGTLKDQFNEPINKAILKFDYNKEVETNELGEYSIKFLKPFNENLQVRISKYGYKDLLSEIPFDNLTEIKKDYKLLKFDLINLKGKILDEKGDPIIDVMISDATENSVKSNINGEFNIKIEKNNPKNKKYIYFEKFAYKPIITNYADLKDDYISITMRKVLPDSVYDKFYKGADSGIYGVLLGTVYNDDGQPVPGATIRLEGTTNGAKAKMDGFFVVKRIREGTYNVKITAIGFKEYKRQIKIKAQYTSEINVILNTKIYDSNQQVMVCATTINRSINQYSSSAREGIGEVASLNNNVSISQDGYYLRTDGQDPSNQYVGPFGVQTSDHVNINNSNIDFTKFESKEEYIKSLVGANKSDFLKKYFELKKKYANYPSFYIDASDIARDMDDKDLALKILSNLAEMQIEKHEIERILGHRLRQLGFANYAIESFAEVLKNKEEEPQSYRDLAWAYADNGEYQKAADLMYGIAKKEWDSRFPEIETIAIVEMNNIIQKSAGKVDISKYDTAFVKKLSFDLVIVLNWDADNTDIDLWVTEPSGEKCFYSNRFTRSGGRLTRDFTGGYGPEVFYIKDASKGEYKIEANYFGSRAQKLTGPATLMLDVYTNYGRKNQEKKSTTIRLKDAKEVINVGSALIN